MQIDNQVQDVSVLKDTEKFQNHSREIWHVWFIGIDHFGKFDLSVKLSFENGVKIPNLWHNDDIPNAVDAPYYSL